jgi:hypothetical protein
VLAQAAGKLAEEAEAAAGSGNGPPRAPVDGNGADGDAVEARR